MKLKRITSILLAALMLMSVVSCGESEVNTETEKTAEAEVNNVEVTAEPEEDTDSRASVKDTLPDDLNFDSRTFTIFHSDKRNRSPYIAGGEEITGEVVTDAAYNSNRTVEDRLNVKIEYNPDPTSDWDTVGGIVSSIVMSGDPMNDFMMGEQYGFCQLVTKGYFMNCFDLDYFNFDMPWWNSDFMANMAITSSKRNFITGDYNVTMVSDANCLYVNKTLYENHFGDLNSLYDEVFEGKWTIDRMSQVVSDAYIDKNGNGTMDNDDQFGYIAYKAYATVDAYQYCANVPYCTRDEDGYIVINMEQERAVTLCEKTYNLIHQTGTNTETIDNTGAFFMQGGALLLHGTLGTAGGLRDMEDDFGIIPVPKLDEEQDSYYTHVGDCVLIDAVPVSSDSTDIAGAVIEALNAETYRYIIPAYYDVALKNKYSRDVASAKMIDLIHDSLNSCFIYIYTMNVGDAGRIMRGIINSNSPDYASTVAKQKKIINKSLEKLIKEVEENDQ